MAPKAGSSDKMKGKEKKLQEEKPGSGRSGSGRSGSGRSGSHGSSKRTPAEKAALAKEKAAAAKEKLVACKAVAKAKHEVAVQKCIKASKAGSGKKQSPKKPTVDVFSREREE